MALNSKTAELKKGIVRKNTIWDTLIFRKVQEGMGGRVRLMVVGSAPLGLCSEIKNLRLMVKHIFQVLII